MKNREQLIKEVAELNSKIDDILKELDTWMKENEKNYTCITQTKKYKNYWKNINSLDKERNEVKYQIELLDGKVWNNEKWATELSSTSYESLEDARTKLADMLSKMNGVEINNEKGVRIVYITTKYKIYRYEIHGHYGSEVIGTEIRKGFKGEYEHPITKVIYLATLKANGWETSKQNWAWRN